MSSVQNLSRSKSRNGCVVAIFTKNEELNIKECIESFQNRFDIFVIDSQSSDRTAEIAASLGASVLQFNWDGKYPRKKQWAIQQLSSYAKVVMFDADLRATPSFLNELESYADIDFGGAVCRISYYFMNKKIRFGEKVKYFGILNPKTSHFPDVEPEKSGYGDIEFHYQPICHGRVITFRSSIEHRDNDPLISWLERHLKYALYQAQLDNDFAISRQVNRMKSPKGRIFARLPFKATVRFVYSYFFLLGFLDGKAGFRYQWLISHHYYLSKIFMSECSDSPKNHE